MVVTLDYVDTCFPEYLTDHYCREGECLIGIPLAGQTESQAVEDILSEVNAADWGIPDDVTDADITLAAEDAVKGMDFGDVPDDDADELCVVWFVLRWETTADCC